MSRIAPQDAYIHYLHKNLRAKDKLKSVWGLALILAI